MPVISGTKVLLEVDMGNTTPDFQPVGSQKGLQINETSSPIPTSSKDTTGGETFLPPTRYNTQITLNHLYVPGAAQAAALKSAQRTGATVIVAKYEDGAKIEQATGIVTAFNSDLPEEGAATVSVSIQVSGDWS